MSPHIFPLRVPQAIAITMQMIAGLKFRFLKQISYTEAWKMACVGLIVTSIALVALYSWQPLISRPSV